MTIRELLLAAGFFLGVMMSAVIIARMHAKNDIYPITFVLFALGWTIVFMLCK